MLEAVDEVAADCEVSQHIDADSSLFPLHHNSSLRALLVVELEQANQLLSFREEQAPKCLVHSLWKAIVGKSVLV